MNTPKKAVLQTAALVATSIAINIIIRRTILHTLDNTNWSNK